MPNIRAKADVLGVINKITAEEHEQLKRDGLANKKHWGIKEGESARVVATFKKEVKKYYYHRQARRCCYCSKELDPHNGSFDAEHILDKDTYPQFMFSLENIAAVCKTCNGAKSSKNVIAPGVDVASVPADSRHYLLVHPHKDEWNDYLDYDRIGRIVAKPQQSKGVETISICGIKYLNAARLADHFLPADNEAAEKALDSFFRVNSRAWKLKHIRTLKTMADEFNLAQARAIVEILELEMEQIQLGDNVE
ncbi:hypothetical protein HCU66_23665 [Pseudomonas frederiksbergensis]|uniref:hypothetical protein n=1 Tax=Pseudomonas frederiksbergensis TaxID=104087 RepID=UPI001980A2B1|nr:hypothetical protein [Pseudomonas frederiksbergensis]MBN3865213.1 hypothetical protein [Pseudomonas frederiksbergensis]